MPLYTNSANVLIVDAMNNYYHEFPYILNMVDYFELSWRSETNLTDCHKFTPGSNAAA